MLFTAPDECASRRESTSIVAIVVALLLSACASVPREGASGARPAATMPASSAERDGPEARPPPDLKAVPDAEPKLEPIRSGGPNKPYEVAGQAYVPITKDASFTERGLASWYGRKFHGRRTASGEVYNMYTMTAAHKTLPIPSYARVRNPANGVEVLVRVNDRGPFVAGRIIDLSYTAAQKLGVLRGVAPVELERITFDDIRSGAWRRNAGDASGRPTTTIAVAADLTPPMSVPLPISATASETVAFAPIAAAPEPPVVSTSASTSASPSASAASPVADAPATRALTPPARGFWVQLGAFRERGGAEDFQRRVTTELEDIGPLLAMFIDPPLYRLQAGPYPSRDEARAAAERVRSTLRLVPVIVERR